MSREFVLNHVHGFNRSFQKILAEWNPKEETLVVMGNVLDYGHNSFLIFTKLFQLDFYYPGKVKFLKGKHELAFEAFYANPRIKYEEYFSMGGLATLTSFYEKGLMYDELKDTDYLLDAVLPYVDFSLLEYYLQHAVSYYETEKAIYVSEEKNVMDAVLEKQWTVDEQKCFYFTSQSDNAFRIPYLNLYLGEEIARTANGEKIAPIIQNNCIFFGEPSLEISTPCITAYRIADGVIVEEISIPAEE